MIWQESPTTPGWYWVWGPHWLEWPPEMRYVRQDQVEAYKPEGLLWAGPLKWPELPR